MTRISPRITPVAAEVNPSPEPAARIGAAPKSRTEDAFVQGTSGSTGARAEERTALVREVLLTSHRQLIGENPAGAKEKFDKLSTSAFSFFRGTAALFYRDFDALDRERVAVLANGDVHPENFGAFRDSRDEVTFGPTDFDEAARAPFAWDVRRGATGFELAARERGFANSERAAIVDAFVEGYLDGLGRKNPEEALARGKLPDSVKKLLDTAEARSRKDLLKKFVDKKDHRFRASDQVHPRPELVDEVQRALDAYQQTLPKAARDASFFRVKDVAEKTGSGTASLGLRRYYVLVEGKSKKVGDDFILELKESRPSVLQPSAPSAMAAARIVDAQKRQVPESDPLLGHTVLNGRSFLVRERQPEKSRIELTKLDAKELAAYARACGQVLARSHASSGEGIAQQILHSEEPKAFTAEMAGFARQKATQLTEDHQAFSRLHSDGAFRFGNG